MANKPRILIVDDEPRMCDSLQVLLGNEGYETLTACNGQKAVECLCEMDIDLLLLWSETEWGFGRLKAIPVHVKKPQLERHLAIGHVAHRYLCLAVTSDEPVGVM